MGGVGVLLVHGNEESFTGEEMAPEVATLAGFGEDNHGVVIIWVRGQIMLGLLILGSKDTI